LRLIRQHITGKAMFSHSARRTATAIRRAVFP